MKRFRRDHATERDCEFDSRVRVRHRPACSFQRAPLCRLIARTRQVSALCSAEWTSVAHRPEVERLFVDQLVSKFVDHRQAAEAAVAAGLRAAAAQTAPEFEVSWAFRKKLSAASPDADCRKEEACFERRLEPMPA